MMMSEVTRSIDLMGIPRTIYYTPPPAFGGFAGPVDLVANVFQLWQFRIEPQMCSDVLDRAIGSYEAEEKRLFLQCFNPFFWVMWAGNRLLSVPFRILGSLGFDANRIEESLFGRLFKALGWLVALLVGIVTLLEKLGYLENLKAYLAK